MGEKTKEGESVHLVKGGEAVRGEKALREPAEAPALAFPEAHLRHGSMPPCPQGVSTHLCSTHLEDTQRPNPRPPRVPLSGGTSGVSLSHARPSQLPELPTGSTGQATLCLYIHLSPPPLWSGVRSILWLPVSHPDSHNRANTPPPWAYFLLRETGATEH